MRLFKAKHYDAFISYSHAADGKLAPFLQRALQQLAKPWYKLRTLYVFRDETDLAATPEGWPNIAAALDASDYFLLLASPESARSKWVRREVEQWIRAGRKDKLFIVLTDGEIVWDDRGKDFDWQRTTALPTVLAKRFDYEPFWVNLRWANKEQHLNLRNPEFLKAVARLTAPIRNLDISELLGSDYREHRRTIRLTWAAVLTLIILTITALGAAISALQQRNVAIKEARTSKSRELAAHAQYLMKTQLDLALLLSVEATRFEKTPQARDSLLASLLERPEALRFFRIEGESAKVVAFSQNARSLATGHLGGAIRVWDIKDRRIELEIRPKENTSVCDLAFRPTDNALVYLMCDGTLGLLPQHSSKPLWESVISAPRRLTSVAVSPDGALLAIGGDSLLLWDAGTGQMLGDALVQDDPYFFAQDLAFSPDSQILAVGNPSEPEHGAVVLLDVRTRTRIRTLTSKFPRGARIEVAFSNDSSLIVSSANGVFVWDTSTGELKAKSSIAFPTNIATSADGRIAVTTSFLSPSSLIVLRSDDGVLKETRLEGHSKSILDVAITPDGRLAASISEDALILWNVSGESQLGTLGSYITLTNEPVTTATIHSNTGKFVIGHRNGMGSFFSHVESGNVMPSTLIFGTSSVTSLAFDSTGDMVAAGMADGTVSVWAGKTKRIAATFKGHTGAVKAVAFSPDGQLLASGSTDMSIRLWKLRDRTDTGILLTRKANRAWINALAFSSDGRILAAALAISGDQVDLWDVPTGQRRADPLDLPGGIASIIAFGPKRLPHILAAAAQSGVLKTWDVTDLDPPVATIQTPPTEDPVSALMFDASGSLIVTGHKSGKIRVWDVVSGQLVGAPIAGIEYPVNAVGFLEREGKPFLAVIRGGELALLQFDTDSWVTEACAIAGRHLTKTEWNRYIGSIVSYQPGCRSEVKSRQGIKGDKRD